MENYVVYEFLEIDWERSNILLAKKYERTFLKAGFAQLIRYDESPDLNDKTKIQSFGRKS